MVVTPATPADYPALRAIRVASLPERAPRLLEYAVEGSVPALVLVAREARPEGAPRGASGSERSERHASREGVSERMQEDWVEGLTGGHTGRDTRPEGAPRGASGSERSERHASREGVSGQKGQGEASDEAVSRDPPVGYALTFRDPESGTATLLELAVAPDVRRRGHGSALLSATVERLSDHDRLELETAVSNTAARTFYEEHGFDPVERVPDRYASGDGLRFVRRL